VRVELRVDEAGQLGVERGEDVCGQLDDRHVDAPGAESLGSLEHDESRAEHDGTPGATGDHGADPLGVGHGAQGADDGEVQARQRWTNGAGARRQDEGVVAEGRHAVGGPDREGLGLAVDRGDLMADPDVEVQCGAQGRGRLYEERTAVLDLVAHVVRQPAVRERDVLTALEDDDLGILGEAARPRGATHPAGDSADDDDPHEGPSAGGGV